MLPTGGKGCGSWATPNTLDGMPPKSAEALKREATIARPGRSKPANLRDQVSNRRSWPTPNANEERAGKYTHETSFRHFKEGRQVHLSQVVRDSRLWPTPRANKIGGISSPGFSPTLEQVAKWPTPTTINRNSRNAIILQGDAHINHGKALSLEQAAEVESGLLPKELKSVDELPAKWKKRWSTPTGAKGSLNPDWVEWLMGWPIGWTSLEPLKEAKILSWERDPADDGDIPRIAAGVEDRVPRLKAIGNGQIPACVIMAWRIL